jgi:hypothetical protein
LQALIVLFEYSALIEIEDLGDLRCGWGHILEQVALDQLNFILTQFIVLQHIFKFFIYQDLSGFIRFNFHLSQLLDDLIDVALLDMNHWKLI